MEIKWEKKYSVGIKEIDAQHKFFLEILNELYKAIGSGKSRIELEILLQKLVEYAEKHFATEEKYFRKFGYENAEEHIKKHREMMEELLNIKRQSDGNEIDFYGNTVYFLKNWLEDHLEKMDHKYVECFKAHGVM